MICDAANIPTMMVVEFINHCLDGLLLMATVVLFWHLRDFTFATLAPAKTWNKL